MRFRLNAVDLNDLVVFGKPPCGQDHALRWAASPRVHAEGVFGRCTGPLSSPCRAR